MQIFDFIIIGSGIAGLNTALQASKKGKILIITKKKLHDSNTFYAQGGIAAVLDKNDRFKEHIKDTIAAGAYHNNRKTVEFIIKNGPTAIQKLINLGVNFEQNHKKTFNLHHEGGHSQKRVAHSGDYTGKEIEETLIKHVRKHKNITIFENCFAVDLIVKNNSCYGLQIIKNNRIKNIFGRKIILAAGGLGQLYSKTTNPKIATGDGIAMAHRAGAKIKDMEFIQFHPTAFAAKKNPLFLLSEALRGEGAILRNAKGKRFMPKYHQDAELAPRDVVSRAIFAEEKKGSVYLDLRAKSPTPNYEKNIQEKFPQIFNYLKKKGLNLAKDLIPITPAAHFSCGGIQTDLRGQTTIKNLLAFGEIACTGLHGANRLASNSLLEGAVMSKEIIKHQLPTIKKFPTVPLTFTKNNTIKTPTKKEKNLIRKIRQKLQIIMWKNVGIIRKRANLLKTKKILQILQKKLPKNLTRVKIETNNMIETSLLIIQAALNRSKSLGAHFIT